jgi:hypothetical protein
MRKYRTDCWQWGAMALVLWTAYLAWDRFTERHGVMWLARDIIEEGRPVRFLRGPGLNGCSVPALTAALVATAVAWLGQAIMIRLGFRFRRASDSALLTDFDDKPPPPAP